MKNRFKILMGSLLVCGLFVCTPAAFAQQENDEAKSDIISSNVVEDELLNDIKKSEKTIIKEKCFGKNFSENKYKYLKVSRSVSYIDNITKNILAMATVNANFRYNPETRQAVCLSTLRNSASYSADYVLDTFSRCTNKNTENGCAIVDIKFTDAGYSGGFAREILDGENYEINCDCSGNITFENL